MVTCRNTLNKVKGVTAIILAGGLSTRMGGQSKSLLPVGGITMIEHIARQLQPHFDQILVSANPTQDFGFLNLPVVFDNEPNKGPLIGIYSCLIASHNAINFVTTCDNPKPDIQLAWQMIAKIEEYDAVVPKSSGETIDPLFAVYKKNVSGEIRKLLEKDIRKVTKLLETCNVLFFEIPEPRDFQNINYPDEFEDFTDKNVKA